MSLFKGSIFNISSSAIVKCTIHCEGCDKGGDEGGGGGDGGDVSGLDGGGQEKKQHNQL